MSTISPLRSASDREGEGELSMVTRPTVTFLSSGRLLPSLSSSHNHSSHRFSRLQARSALCCHVGYSPSQVGLIFELSFSISSLRRSAVWRCLLGVSSLSGEPFHSLDTVSPHGSDRQLDVDIPRCHQYEEVMTSPAAHYKLKRLLKVTVD